MSSEFKVREDRRPRHHWADNEIIDIYGPKIGFTGYAIYMYLGRHANNKTGKCCKTQYDIAKAFGGSRDTVNRHMNTLIDNGLVATEHAIGKPMTYVLLEVIKVGTYLPQIQTPTCGKNRQDLPQIQTDLPQIQTVYKEVILIQDSIKTKTKTNTNSPLIEEEIYIAYPRKIGKVVALRAIRRALLKIDGLWLLGRTKIFAASSAGQAGEFTPHPATWFNQERYNDDEKEWDRKGTTNGKNKAELRESRTEETIRAVAERYIHRNHSQELNHSQFCLPDGSDEPTD